MKYLKLLIPIIIVVVIFLITITLIEPKIVKVGFITDLSGKNSGLGIGARNGLNMAIEEINSLGGINNHIIELIIKDHEGSKELCLKGTKELVNEGVSVIISPILSGMASTVIQGVGTDNVLIIGPTVSTDELTGIDDNFIRVSPASSKQGERIAEISIKNGDKKVVVILDEKNRAYTAGVVKGFKETIVGSDVQIVKTLKITENIKVEELLPELLTIKADAIFFIANGLDSGSLIQFYAKVKTLPRLYGSSWVKASAVHEYGGSRVEGMIFADSLVNPEPVESERKFNKKYTNKFGIPSNTVSVYFYESLYMYKYGGDKAKSFDMKDVKQAIIDIKDYKGIIEDYSIDKYGDGIRSIVLYIIKNNKYYIFYE